MVNHPNRRKGYKRQRIVIPAGLAFADLKLTRENNGDVSFDTSVVRRIAEASGLDAEFFLSTDEDNAAGLIVAWYQDHRATGGAPDPTAEDLIAEARIEGDGGSHYPGRA